MFDKVAELDIDLHILFISLLPDIISVVQKL